MPIPFPVIGVTVAVRVSGVSVMVRVAVKAFPVTVGSNTTPTVHVLPDVNVKFGLRPLPQVAFVTVK